MKPRKKVKYKFVDAQKMAVKYPSTFKAPSEAELQTLRAGDHVKVCHNDERFWVLLTDANERTLKGRVNNVLVCRQPFKCGDTVQFERKHVYDTMTKEH